MGRSPDLQRAGPGVDGRRAGGNGRRRGGANGNCRRVGTVDHAARERRPGGAGGRGRHGRYDRDAGGKPHARPGAGARPPEPRFTGCQTGPTEPPPRFHRLNRWPDDRGAGGETGGAGATGDP